MKVTAGHFTTPEQIEAWNRWQLMQQHFAVVQAELLKHDEQDGVDLNSGQRGSVAVNQLPITFTSPPPEMVSADFSGAVLVDSHGNLAAMSVTASSEKTYTDPLAQTHYQGTWTFHREMHGIPGFRHAVGVYSETCHEDNYFDGHSAGFTHQYLVKVDRHSGKIDYDSWG